MGTIRNQIFRSNVIINSASLITTEQDANYFEIIGFNGGGSGVLEEKPSLRATIAVRRYNDLVLVGAEDCVFKNLIKGDTYWFQARIVTNSGLASNWSNLTSEVVGDNTNDITISNPVVTTDSTGVLFKIEVDKIPSDFKEFQWVYTTEAASLTSDPVKFTPSQPGYPSKNATPFTVTSFTNGIDNITVSAATVNSISVTGLIAKLNEFAGKSILIITTKETYTIASNTVTDSNGVTTFVMTADFITAPVATNKAFISVHNSQVSFVGTKTTWYHVWVRALDTSGNISPLTNNNWFYAGCGKVLNYNPLADSDNRPPDMTDTIKPSFVSADSTWIGAVIS